MAGGLDKGMGMDVDVDMELGWDEKGFNRYSTFSGISLFLFSTVV
jgi:hypothetical protein